MPLPDGSGNAGTHIVLRNADFSTLKVLTDALAGLGKISGRSLSDGVGTFNLAHSGSADDVAEFISNKLGNKYAIVELNDHGLTIEPK